MKKITIENAAYKWFDMKLSTYDKLETDDSIYLYDEGDEYADIAIYKKYRNIYYDWYFWEEFSEIFPIERDEFKEIISNWVDDTFGLKGFTSWCTTGWQGPELKIPK